MRRLRVLAVSSGGVYLAWWFMVQLLLPPSFNPLPGRLLVVALNVVLVGASTRSAWVRRRFSVLYTTWLCILVAHYCYLIAGNDGDPTWWLGAFVTFAAASMCAQSPRDVATFSVFSLGCAVVVAAREGKLGDSIYVPGLATILLLANITKRNQVIAQDATLRAEFAQDESRRADEQRLQLAAIVESSGDAIIATDLGGVIQSWNKGAERLFGYVASEVTGRPLSILLPDGRVGEEAALVAHLSRGDQVAPVETVRRHENGTDLDVSITVSPIRDSRGGLVGVSLTARDISDRKRALAEVRRASQAAQAANRELEAFNYSVAHDLRSPLRGIDGFARLLVEDYGSTLDETGKRHLDRIGNAARRMGELIDGLLALSRLTRVGLRSERVDLSALARVTADRLRAAQPQRAVAFVIRDGLVVDGDGALLAALLENLLNNAWKFTRHAPNARIELGADEEAGETVYFVRDNGAGFDMAYAAKLFGAFQRLHAESEFEGTGIGLATVQRIVERHGGRIWAEGKVGEGACFRFTLHDADGR